MLDSCKNGLCEIVSLIADSETLIAVANSSGQAASIPTRIGFYKLSYGVSRSLKLDIPAGAVSDLLKCEFVRQEE